ncbi:MAG: PspC domain-containing protein, partial [Candidatus Berkelbacteria bacterium]
KKLYRSSTNRVFGGVAAGLGEYFDIDPSLVRLAFVIVVLMGGIGLAIYIVAWVVIPNEPSTTETKTGADEIKEKAETIASEIKSATKDLRNDVRRRHDSKAIFGMIILIIGLLLLFQNIIGVNLWHNFWPVILILIGFAVMINSLKK